MSDLRKTFTVELYLAESSVREHVDAELDGLLRELRAEMESWLDEVAA
jgi:hypothetical protein